MIIIIKFDTFLLFFFFPTMSSINKKWTCKDILDIRNVCKKSIAQNNPPPRAILRGEINVEHFIYHNESLKLQIEVLKKKLTTECHVASVTQEHMNDRKLQKQYVISQRKLNNRNLQLEQLKKRISNLHTVNTKLQKEINLKQIQIVKIENEKNELMYNFNQEITDLKDLIKNLEPEEFESEQSQKESHIHSFEPNGSIVLKEEDRSQSSEPNTQDNAFTVSDDDYNMIADDDYSPSVSHTLTEDDEVSSDEEI